MAINYLCGAIPSPPDERDYSVRAAAKTALPKEHCLQRMPDIREQQAGNCVSQSCRAVCEILFGKLFGVGFTYGYRPVGYHQGQGMIPREAAQTVTNMGNVLFKTFKTEVEMPEAKNAVERNLDALTKHAAKNKIKSYARCYCVDDIKTAIVAGNPVIFGAAIQQYNVEAGNVFPCKKAVHGYHEMTIVGYKGDMCRVANSWGKDWGDKGYCWISFEDVLREGDVIAFSNGTNDVTIRRTLKLGMSGEDVRRLEERLNEEKGISINPDGIFNESTKRAVEVIQKRLGLPVSGTVGTRTWRALGL